MNSRNKNRCVANHRIHSQYLHRVLRRPPFWLIWLIKQEPSANLQIQVVAKQSSKRSVTISTDWKSQSWLASPIRNPYPATAIILWKNSGECRISWPVSTQARQLPTAIQVMLYRRLFSTAQPRQATQQLLVTVALRSSYLMAGTVGGMFTGVTFNNSPVNISINFQTNRTPTSDSLQWKKNS